MYLQIVTRCNMTCAHCCMAATREGQDMSMHTFYAALKRVQGNVTIGGGEPTLHRRFWDILMESKSYMEFEYGDGSVWLATNGKKKRIALALASLAKSGAIACSLSRDSYHDPIDPKVVAAFTVDRDRRGDNDYRDIRNVDGRLINSGRCDFGSDNSCVCAEMMIKPDGSVYSCGCRDAIYFGNVNAELCIPDGWDNNDCWKSKENRSKI